MRRKYLINLAVAATLGATLTTPARAWWNDAWTTRTEVRLDTSAKGLTLPAAVTDVVLPLRLHSGNFDFAAVQADGSDLRVVGADDKTALPFEIERFDPINELALIWVRVPAVAQNSDKNLLHVYAGNDKAPAEPRPPAFAQGYAAVLHFSEADGPAVDAAGGSKTSTSPAREPNGLLGGALRMDGAALELPLAGRLKLSASGGFSATLWIKPDSAGDSATLLAIGPLKLLRNVDQIELQLVGVKLSGGALPAAAWSQVGVSIGGGKASLYVNGKPVGQTDLLLPEADAPLLIGAGFKGLLDEVEVLPGVRDEAWMRASAAAQGAEGSFVQTQKESRGEASGEGGSPGYLGILLKNLTTDAWVVIGILMVMFVIALWVMVTKFAQVSRTGRANNAFVARFRDSRADQAIAAETAFAPSSLYRLYSTGLKELDKRRQAGQASLSGASFNAIRATLDADLVRENHALNERIVLLTIAIAGGPFLGLLGTVVGVMITFAAIAAAGDVNVNAIAPGIAAALLATVAGLSVAIPSLFGYNYLAAKIKTISSDMQIFVDEFVTRAAEVHGDR